jgi:HK97 family phage prohead protease
MKEKITIYKKLVPNDLTVEDEGNGYIIGYAATWETDQDGDKINKGSFIRTIQQRVKAGKVVLMSEHFQDGGGTMEAIGTVVSAEEDDYGLLIRAEFAETENAQEVRKLCKKIKMGLSVGADHVGPIQYSKTGFIANECKLREITITPFPANDNARIVITKSLEKNDVIQENEEVIVSDSSPTLDENQIVETTPEVVVPINKSVSLKYSNLLTGIEAIKTIEKFLKENK